MALHDLIHLLWLHFPQSSTCSFYSILECSTLLFSFLKDISPMYSYYLTIPPWEDSLWPLNLKCTTIQHLLSSIPIISFFSTHYNVGLERCYFPECCSPRVWNLIHGRHSIESTRQVFLNASMFSVIFLWHDMVHLHKHLFHSFLILYLNLESYYLST